MMISSIFHPIETRPRTRKRFRQSKSTESVQSALQVISKSSYFAEVGFCHFPLRQYHQKCADKSDEAVTNVSKHNSKKERKGDNREQAWIDFLVSCNTIAVDDGLVSFSKLIGPVKSGRFLICAYLLKDRRNASSRFFLLDICKECL